MRLRKLIGDMEEENSQLAHMKLSLEESCEQVTSSVLTMSQCCCKLEQRGKTFYLCFFKVNSNILDKSNDLKQLREQIGKLDEQLDSGMQVKPSQICPLHCDSSAHKLKEAFCFSVYHCVFFYTLCVCVRRSWTKMRRAGRRRSSRWRTIVSSWRRRSTMGTTRPCSS